MKAAVLDAILEKLRAELALASRSAKEAAAAATDEENKPENEYDTRALEASYLASAQSQRVATLERAVHALSEMRSPPPAAARITVGSLVETEFDGMSRWFFLWPAAAGITVEVQGHKISVLGAEAPVARSLTGKAAGDSVELTGPGGAREFEIVAIL